MNVIMSLFGMVFLIILAFILSKERSAIHFRTILGAFSLQFLIGGFVLYVPWGRSILSAISAAVQKVIDYGREGIEFLFGNLVNFSLEGIGFIVAFQVLPTIIYFSALISVLYYLGVMQWMIKILGGGLQKLLATSRAESMSSAANIFVGQTEAPLVVRPFIATMTQSELFAIMCGGLASVAGSVLAAYASMGVPLEYLVAASFMAAPGGLLFAKIILPETEQPIEHFSEDQESESDKPANIIDAAACGASTGLRLALNVGAMLLAFIGLIALINGILGDLTTALGMPTLTLELILGWLFAPLAFLIGVPWEEAVLAGSFIGQKLIVNEFVAYLNFVPYLGEDAQLVTTTGALLSDKSIAIISFALCGFANLSSIAILLGGLAGLAPKRRQDIARMGLAAVAAGTLSNLMSATIAGFFISL